MRAKGKLKGLGKRLPKKREELAAFWYGEDPGKPYYIIRRVPKPGGGWETIEENLEEAEEKGTQINADRRR